MVFPLVDPNGISDLLCKESVEWSDVRNCCGKVLPTLDKAPRLREAHVHV